MNLNITPLEPERVNQFVRWWGDPQKEVLIDQINRWREVATIEAAKLQSNEMGNSQFSQAASEKLVEAEKFVIALEVLKGVDSAQLIGRIEL